MQADIFEKPLEDWTLYQIVFEGSKFNAWHKNGSFIATNRELIDASKVDSYIKIRSLNSETETKHGLSTETI